MTLHQTHLRPVHPAALMYAEEVKSGQLSRREFLTRTTALGAEELRAHLLGHLPLPEARDRAVQASRLYAKRQRTWFRSRMGNWQALALPSP